jgi:YgiT-type zinc finger domain-containing protein
MKCVICHNGMINPNQSTTVTLERNGVTIVIKKVPASVCDICGETYIEEKVTNALLMTANEAIQAGVEVDIRHYKAA